MLRHLKSLFVALGVTTAGAGVAAADEYRGATTTIYGGGGVTIGAELHVGTPAYGNVDYRYDYGHVDPQPGPGYVIPSSPSPGYVGYPRQDLRPRRGFTWVQPRYEHRYGRMVYVPGHWERIAPRRGFVWVEDHIEYRHGRAVYVPGHWERVRGRNWARGYYR